MSSSHYVFLFLCLYILILSRRHCATSRKVAGSISDCVIGIFHLHNTSGRAMVLGLTQPLTEISTRNVSWGPRRPVRRADNPTIFMCRLSWYLGASASWNPQGLSRPVMGLLYHLIYIKMNVCLFVLWNLYKFSFLNRSEPNLAHVSLLVWKRR